MNTHICHIYVQISETRDTCFQPVQHPSIPPYPTQLQYERTYSTSSMLYHTFSDIPECTFASCLRLIQYLSVPVPRYGVKQQPSHAGTVWEPGGSSKKKNKKNKLKTIFQQIFLESFCLLDLRQACLSLIITQVLFSARCVLYFQREGLVNRSGGVRGDR